MPAGPSTLAVPTTAGQGASAVLEVGVLPPTAAYLLGRLVRRHKLAVASGAAIAAALVIGAAAAVWQGVRAKSAADRAELEAQRAELEAGRARGAEQHALATLAELSATAPVFAAQARELAAKGKLDEAIEKLTYAVKLRPGVPEYLVERGDLLRKLTPICGAAIPAPTIYSIVSCISCIKACNSGVLNCSTGCACCSKMGSPMRKTVLIAIF